MKLLIISSILLGLSFTGCAPAAEESKHRSVILDSLASCPFITFDQEKCPVISYVAALNDSTYVMRYQISSDDGKTFGTVIEIPVTANVKPHEENLPKIIFKPDHEII